MRSDSCLRLSSPYFCSRSFYVSFAAIYYADAEDCVLGIESFTNAVWFSVQSAATIGYGGEMTPNPDCFRVNLAVSLQVESS